MSLELELIQELEESIKRLGLDLGNGKVKAVGIVGKEFKCEAIDSIYTLETTLGCNIVEVEGEEPIALGRGEYTLVNLDKTSREYIKHQILWSVYKIFGDGEHSISLVTGLPLELYKNKSRRQEFLKQLEGLDVIKGKVEGRSITVKLEKVKIAAEGHAALRILKEYLDENCQNLILDIGEGTTDGVLVEYVNGKLSLQNYKSIQIGIQDVFKAMQKEIVKETGLIIEPTMYEIDRAFNRENAIIKGLNGECNLKDCIKKDSVVRVIIKLLDNVQNIFGELPRLKLILIGGGSKFIELALEEHKMKDKYLNTLVAVPNEERYFANAKGYACQA